MESKNSCKEDITGVEVPYIVELPGGVPVCFEPTIIHYYFAKGRITLDECIVMLAQMALEEEGVVV